MQCPPNQSYSSMMSVVVVAVVDVVAGVDA
jgi:hypothetical protein